MKKFMYEKRRDQVEIVTDLQALNMDLRDKALVVYGTVNGNLFLSRYYLGIPVHIEPSRIVADQAYTGSNLKFITAWPHPRNPESGMVIYTAQRAADIPGINNVFHGPTDYIIFVNRETVLKSGYYRKEGGHWFLD